MMPHASAPADGRPPAPVHRPSPGQASAHPPGVVLQIVVRIEDREAAVARHGAQTVDSLQRHIENWPSTLAQGDGPAGGAMPPASGGEARARNAADARRAQPAFRTGNARVMLGVAILISLGLWFLIFKAIRMLF